MAFLSLANLSLVILINSHLKGRHKAQHEDTQQVQPMQQLPPKHTHAISYCFPISHQLFLPGTLLIPKEASGAQSTPYLSEGGWKGHLVQVELGHALEGNGEHNTQAAKVQAGSLEDVCIDGLRAFQDVP